MLKKFDLQQMLQEIEKEKAPEGGKNKKLSQEEIKRLVGKKRVGKPK